jgi:hypothetical protein
VTRWQFVEDAAFDIKIQRLPKRFRLKNPVPQMQHPQFSAQNKHAFGEILPRPAGLPSTVQPLNETLGENR